MQRPAEEMSFAERLSLCDPETRAKHLAALTDGDLSILRYMWRGWLARPKQLAPPTLNPRSGRAWVFWMLQAGRGFGKTRTAAEWILERVDAGARRITIAGATAADVRSIIVEGESGLLACAPPWNRPIYEPSKRRLTWHRDGRPDCIAELRSGEEPDGFRGIQCDTFWCDELASWQYPSEAWEMILYGFRLGESYGMLPQGVVSTTPRPIPVITGLRDNIDCVVTRGSSIENFVNLNDVYKHSVIMPRLGTRLGRQEIDADILDDNPAALWRGADIEDSRWNPPDVTTPDAVLNWQRGVRDRCVRIVVGIDPAVSSDKLSNETGIVAAGLIVDPKAKDPRQRRQWVVFEDASGRYTPEGWASEALKLVERWDADAIVAEVNNGGDLVTSNIRNVSRDRVRVIAVRASRGKELRAEPIAALYEQHRVHHLGAFPKLEDQMTQWDPTGGHEIFDKEAKESTSPDRMDALVWALTDLSESAGSSGGKAPPVSPSPSFEDAPLGA